MKNLRWSCVGARPIEREYDKHHSEDAGFRAKFYAMEILDAEGMQDLQHIFLLRMWEEEDI